MVPRDPSPLWQLSIGCHPEQTYHHPYHRRTHPAIKEATKNYYVLSHENMIMIFSLFCFKIPKHPFSKKQETTNQGPYSNLRTTQKFNTEVNDRQIIDQNIFLRVSGMGYKQISESNTIIVCIGTQTFRLLPPYRR